MKTNHQRQYKAKKHSDKAMQGWKQRDPISGKTFTATISNDFTDGHRGMAKAAKAAKKYINSRMRFHANNETRKLANHVTD